MIKNYLSSKAAIIFLLLVAGMQLEDLIGIVVKLSLAGELSPKEWRGFTTSGILFASLPTTGYSSLAENWRPEKAELEVK